MRISEKLASVVVLVGALALVGGARIAWAFEGTVVGQDAPIPVVVPQPGMAGALKKPVPPAPIPNAPAALTGSTVSATRNPQVALYTVQMPGPGSATVQFGQSTSYGRKTSSKTATAAGPLSFLVAGMLPNSTAHLQAQVQLSNGSNASDTDQTAHIGEGREHAHEVHDVREPNTDKHELVDGGGVLVDNH